MIPSIASRIHKQLLPIIEDLSKSDTVRMEACGYAIQLLIMQWENRRAKQRTAQAQHRAREKAEAAANPPSTTKPVVVTRPPSGNALGIE